MSVRREALMIFMLVFVLEKFAPFLVLEKFAPFLVLEKFASPSCYSSRRLCPRCFSRYRSWRGQLDRLVPHSRSRWAGDFVSLQMCTARTMLAPGTGLVLRYPCG